MIALMDTGIHKNRFGGYSYFRSSMGFSINEGIFPNLTVLWGEGRFFFYVGVCRLFGRRIRLYFSVPLRRSNA